MERIVSGFTFAFASSFIRYLLFAGAGFVIFYVSCRRLLLHRKIQQRFPDNIDYLREIAFSFTTCVIFGMVGAIIFSPFVRPHTLIYFKVAERGWLYFVACIPAMVLVHDAYFYWSHRFLHWKPVFRVVHSLHHRSNNPSPWAALSFHPLEAIVQAGVFIVLAFFIPVHPMALLIFFAWTTFSNVVGHLGFEIFPRRLTESRWGRWLNSSTNHNIHHQRPNGNYGLFFRFWDEWMGTTHTSYNEVLRKVQSQLPYQNLAQGARPRPHRYGAPASAVVEHCGQAKSLRAGRSREAIQKPQEFPTSG